MPRLLCVIQRENFLSVKLEATEVSDKLITHSAFNPHTQ